MGFGAPCRQLNANLRQDMWSELTSLKQTCSRDARALPQPGYGVRTRTDDGDAGGAAMHLYDFCFCEPCW